jgi:hypothetical protein
LTAASVRTRVVSWKDAADKKESVARKLGDAEQYAFALAGFRPLLSAWHFQLQSQHIDHAAGNQIGCRPDHQCESCASTGGYDFNVLVIDFNTVVFVTLRTSLIMYFCTRGLLNTHDVMRVDRSSVSRSPPRWHRGIDQQRGAHGIG